MLKIILLKFLLTHANCHTPKNNGDVIVNYGGHAEANSDAKPIITEKPKTKITVKTTINDKPVVFYLSTTMTEVPPEYETDTESVVFIPNERERETYRRYDDDYLEDDGVKIGDILNTAGGVNINVETESPNKDIVFITGKNNENIDKTKEPKSSKKELSENGRRTGQETQNKILPRLDCKHLNCNDTIRSLCGGKIEHKAWKYRLFRNECYFRKVNCAFSYDANRYEVVPLDKCKNVGVHLLERQYYFHPLPMYKKEKKDEKTRTNFASRRSMNKDMYGLQCSHTCPTTCPDDYEPQCAMAGTGQLKVFLNHCKLDYSSCVSGHAWQIRPLSTCVGGKKADMRQNRAFIGWMQRVGIVDNKGRLSLS